MRTGLILGKFLPLHKGHLALIDFARKRCDRLTVLVCAAESENIPGETRLTWIKELYEKEDIVHPILLHYDENSLPNTSVSSRETAKKWGEVLKSNFKGFDIVFSSEEYGAYLAEFLNAAHISFDPARSNVPVSASEIRQNPLKFWDFIPVNVRPYFVKKICIVGTESTGKSTLTEKLAQYFKAAFVPETAREVIEKTEECAPHHLLQIAERHAKAIIEAGSGKAKLVFVDTDVNLTRSYSRFLFGKELEVEKWIDDANRFHLYLYLDKDAGYVQDGTRLGREARDRLDIEHRRVFNERKINYVLIKGDWEEKLRSAAEAVKARFDLFS